jgi:hypothetical protein
MKITLYTINCPQCIVLEKKLKIDGIRFDIIEDEAVFNEKGITRFPMLEVDDKMLSLGEAVQWLKEIKNGH